MADQGLGCTDYCKFVFMNQGLGGKAGNMTYQGLGCTDFYGLVFLNWDFCGKAGKMADQGLGVQIFADQDLGIRVQVKKLVKWRIRFQGVQIIADQCS